jgi:hypothetical protein
LLSPVILLLAIWGARKAEYSPKYSPSLVAMLSVAAIVGYLGVARWVSYPFIPARLLWLLPFLCVAVTLGILHLKQPTLRRTILAAIALSYLSSCFLYFRRENYLNLGYAAPLPEIAAMLNRDAEAGDIILVDSYNTDFQALALYLSGRTRMIALDRTNASAALNAARVAGTVWVVRNTRDISPGGLTPKTRSEACAGRPERQTLLEPYAPWQKAALSLAGFRPPPTHFYEVTACEPAMTAEQR